MARKEISVKKYVVRLSGEERHKQLVEEGFEAVLSRKQRVTPAVARIFDGEKEAQLIALACSKPPKGRARCDLTVGLRRGGCPTKLVIRASCGRQHFLPR